MNKPLANALIGLWAACVGLAHAKADEQTPQLAAGLAFGYTAMDFNAKLDSDPVFPSMVLTGSASWDKFYASLSFADSLGDESISEEEDVGDASRTDLDLTVGYRLTDRWSVYLGYKDSETDIDFRLRDDDLRRDEVYRKDGYFFGTTYTLPLNNAGNLSFNLGYVDLDTDNTFLADVEDDDEEDNEPLEFDDLSGDQKGDADGLSYGISWTIPVNDQLLFNTTFKVNNYDEEIRFNGQTFDADQTLRFFNVGVLYLF